MAIEKLKRHKSPGIDQTPANCLKQGTEQFARRSINTNYFSIEEELPKECRGSIIVPIYKTGDRTECNKYRGITLLSTTYKILSNILLQKLTPYAQEITGDHQCGFRRIRSTTDHIFYIRQVLEKKWE
jgi:hypothetical protein